MTIEISLAIAILSTISAFVFGLMNIRRAGKHETKENSERMATVITKLDTIESAVKEIKADMCNVKNESILLRERVVRVEQAAEQAHQRLERMESRGAK